MSAHSRREVIEIVDNNEEHTPREYTLEAKLNDEYNQRSWFCITNEELTFEGKSKLLELAWELEKNVDRLDAKTLKINDIGDVNLKRFHNANIPEKEVEAIAEITEEII